MTATWIADALRAGGCAVDETVVPDWKTRGHTDGPRMDTVVGVVGHHTAGGASGNLPSLGTVRDGRSDLAGPLANLMLSRAGVWVPIAAGRCWHAGAADRPAAWPWVPNGDANGYCLGIEAESAGTGDWTAAQLAAYPKGVAALLKSRGLPASRFIGHKEWAPSRKPDPHGWPGDIAGFRSTVTAHLEGTADMPLTQADLQAIADAVWLRQIKNPTRVASAEVMLANADSYANTSVFAIRDAVAAAVGKPTVDVKALAAAIVAALPAAQATEVAQAVVDQLGQRISTTPAA